jgi:glycosyltransferase involved in cell wall biosynthesis
MNSSRDISIVIPAYNEAESLKELSEWISRVMHENGFTWEVIFVDDGSSDGTWEVIESLHAVDERFTGLRFRRNYGKSAALNCGFEIATGEVVITMDADLQDSPEEIPEMVRMITSEKYDLISGWKKKRFDPLSKTIPTKLFNWMTRKLSGIPLHDFNCGLKAYRLEVAKNIEVYGEMHRYIPVIAKWSGFRRIGEKIVKHQARKYGTTKFGMERFINGFLDLLSITFISRFGKKPMHFFGTMGTLVFFVGFVMTGYLGIHKVWVTYRGLRAPLITDNPLFFLALVCMILGTQLFLAGFLAEMIARNSSDRNRYQVKQRTGSSTH